MRCRGCCTLQTFCPNGPVPSVGSAHDCANQRISCGLYRTAWSLCAATPLGSKSALYNRKRSLCMHKAPLEATYHRKMVCKLQHTTYARSRKHICNTHKARATTPRNNREALVWSVSPQGPGPYQFHPFRSSDPVYRRASSIRLATPPFAASLDSGVLSGRGASPPSSHILPLLSG